MTDAVGDGRSDQTGARPLRSRRPFYPAARRVSPSTKETFDTYVRPARGTSYTFVNVAGDPSDATHRGRSRLRSPSSPTRRCRPAEAWIDQQDEDFNQFLNLLYVLLALSVIVSIFGIGEHARPPVFERTRERDAPRGRDDPAADAPDGAARERHHRADRATLGLPLGVFLAALVTRALQEFDVRFSIPWGQLVFFAVVAVIVGIVAAIMPARRAAKLDPLRALQYE